MTGKELEPLPPEVANLPSPRDFAELLRERLESEIIRVREERGPVAAPEDTHALVRSLLKFSEVVDEYARGLSTVGKEARQEIENELADGVGEQSPGVPTQGMDVPDLDGTMIKISLVNANDYTIDVPSLRGAIAAFLSTKSDMVHALREAVLEDAMFSETSNLADALMPLLVETMQTLEEAGNYTPQVSKVRALAKRIGGQGLDTIASVVSGSILKKTTYKGVKVAREQPKEK
jgi:hypothetical protein